MSIILKYLKTLWTTGFNDHGITDLSKQWSVLKYYTLNKFYSNIVQTISITIFFNFFNWHFEKIEMWKGYRWQLQSDENSSHMTNLIGEIFWGQSKLKKDIL